MPLHARIKVHSHVVGKIKATCRVNESIIIRPKTCTERGVIDDGSRDEEDEANEDPAACELA